MRFGINIIRIHYSNSCGNSYCIFTFHLHGANEKFSSIEEIRVSNSFLKKQIIDCKVFEKLLTQFRLNILHLTYWELNFIVG